MIERPLENRTDNISSPARILPSDVRYALQYREAQLGTEEILDLARNSFEHESLYIFLKAAVINPELQLDLMKKTVHAISQAAPDENAMRSTIRELIETNIQELATNSRTPAMKLAQYSRQDPVHWQQLYENKAKEAAARENPTFLLGHSTFVGLASFVTHHQQRNKPLHALIPSFIENEEFRSCGYKIHGGSAEFLSKDFDRMPDSIVIDDVIRTGAAERFAQRFWTRDGVLAPVKFEFLSRVEI